MGRPIVYYERTLADDHIMSAEYATLCSDSRNAFLDKHFINLAPLFMSLCMRDPVYSANALQYNVVDSGIDFVWHSY